MNEDQQLDLVDACNALIDWVMDEDSCPERSMWLDSLNGIRCSISDEDQLTD